MTSPLINALFYGYLEGVEEIREVFSDRTLLQKWLDTEAALAKAEGQLGVIPSDAADEIVRKADASKMDLDKIMDDMSTAVHPIFPIIRSLEVVCEKDAGQYIHWGATTQDIMDTANSLQLRDAAQILKKQLASMEASLCRLAKAHRDTPMAGRTHGQHAVPITFGFKVAVWLSEWQRHIERFDQCCERVLVGQLSGAAGTLATLPDKGLEVQALMMSELGLGVADIAWHTARDSYAEWCMVMAQIAGTCGKIANEIISLQKTGIEEVEEPHNAGKIGSSTMPHKRNPMLCEAIMGISQLVRGHVNTAVFGLVHEHERDMGPWQAEWQYMPDMTCQTSGAIALTTRVLNGLVVNADRMLQNLAETNGMICSESVMINLSPRIGRQNAHEIVYEASMAAHEKHMPLSNVLLENKQLSSYMNEDELLKLFSPEKYLGNAGAFVDRVLARSPKVGK